MHRGYIKLFRCTQQNRLWEEKPFDRARAWIDLILLANHKDGYIRVRGNSVQVKRGWVGWSEDSLANRWGWSRGKVNRFKNELENEQQIIQQKNNVTSLICIVNYEKYQGDDTTDSTTDNTTDGRQTVQQTDTNKNVKKLKKEKKEPIAPCAEIIARANQILGKNFKPVEGNTKHIEARWADGFREDDFDAACKNMLAEWGNDPKMSQYLRPETLFGNKMDGYVNKGTATHQSDLGVYR